MIMTILLHTPVWVWFLLAALVAFGLRQRLPRAVSPARLTLLPLLVVVVSLWAVAKGFAAPAAALGGWLAAFATIMLAAGDALGVRGARWDAGAGRVIVPGSLVPLAVILTMFCAKYVAAVSVAFVPQLAGNPVFVAGFSALYGACAGVFVARSRSLRGLVRHTGVAQAA